MNQFLLSVGGLLILVGLTIWIAPGWNGFLFPRTPMDPAQGQLIGIIAIVGGAIVLAISARRR